MILIQGGQIIFPLLLFITLQLSFKLAYSCGPGPGGYWKRAGKPLVLYERAPKLGELSEGGSGPAKGKIRRNTPEFEKLKTVWNTDIVFKDEERSGADRIMTMRCKQKLNKLANLVKNQWSKEGVRLRVIEAWDENSEHVPDSLHYEGRAVDITTSDRDLKKYGQLARLAVQAGFDWIKYENKQHIHASVRDDSYIERSYAECFPDDAKVKLENGSSIRMRELKLGDRVETMDNHGQIAFSEVLMFLDHIPGLSGVLYYVIITDKPYSRLALTGSHLIFTKDCNSSTKQLTVKHAKFVDAGECVVVAHESNLVYAKIQEIRLERRTGAIAPLTAYGNIVVDSVVTSCYAMIDDQELAHLAFSPVRFVHQYAPSFLNTDSVRQNGMHWYVRLLKKINSIVGAANLIS